jgi:hypothetical protein
MLKPNAVGAVTKAEGPTAISVRGSGYMAFALYVTNIGHRCDFFQRGQDSFTTQKPAHLHLCFTPAAHQILPFGLPLTSASLGRATRALPARVQKSLSAAANLFCKILARHKTLFIGGMVCGRCDLPICG